MTDITNTELPPYRIQCAAWVPGEGQCWSDAPEPGAYCDDHKPGKKEGLEIDKPENLRAQSKVLAEEIIKLVREKAELRETVDSLRAEKADLGSKYMASIDEERAENYQLRKDANEWQAKYQMDMDSMNQVIDEERKEKAHLEQVNQNLRDALDNWTETAIYDQHGEPVTVDEYQKMEKDNARLLEKYKVTEKERIEERHRADEWIAKYNNLKLAYEGVLDDDASDSYWDRPHPRMGCAGFKPDNTAYGVMRDQTNHEVSGADTRTKPTTVPYENVIESIASLNGRVMELEGEVAKLKNDLIGLKSS